METTFQKNKGSFKYKMILQQIMRQQKKLLDFQIPFEVSSGNSNGVSAVSNLSQEAEQILIGSCLGDGSLISPYSKGVYYTEIHSINQKEYLEYKENILNKFFVIKHRIFEGYGRNKNRFYYEIRSLDNHKLKTYYDLFYKGKNKTITQTNLIKLKPLGIAIWFMDDGNYNYRTNLISIATNCFSYQHNKIIVDYFRQIHNIIFKIQKTKADTYFIRITSQFYENKFIELVSPFIIDSMKYKIGCDIIKSKKFKSELKLYTQKYYKENRLSILKKQMIHYYHKKDLKQQMERYFGEVKE